jgi:hypothetical protein
MYPPGYAPAPPPRRKGRVGLIIGAVSAAVVVVCGLGFGLLYAAGTHLGTAARATATAEAIPTATQVKATAPQTGTVIFRDDFSSASSGWNNDANCFYSSGSYHIKNGYVCYAPAGSQSDVAISVRVAQISGTTTHLFGIAFRIAPQTQDHYEFDISGEGEWGFFKCIKDMCNPVVDVTSDPSIHRGLNTPNALQVYAKGSHFDLYINGTKVGQADDTTFMSGEVGLWGDTDSEYVFDTLTIARLS